MSVRRLLWPVALTLIILGLAGRSSSVVDTLGNAPPTGIILELPGAYVAFSPVSRVLDALTLFSIPQTVGFFVGIFVCVVASVALRKENQRSKGARLLRGLIAVVLLSGVAEVAAIVLPRPMAKLKVRDTEVVVVDFHSHTSASHDANQRFTPERNREWHSSAGFDVAYVTDHVKWGGALAAKRLNPDRAGTRTSLLTGVEGHYHKVSTILLNVTESDSASLSGWGELKPGSPVSEARSVAIVALPANIDSIESAIVDTLPRFSGIELIDAAPRGLGQFDRDEARIRGIATANHLILIASSNNHGWGRAAAAWNLIRIPGWRSLPPDSVGRLVEQRFRNRDLSSVLIVYRNRPQAHGAAVALTLPITLVEIVGSLTNIERAVWIAWVWGGFMIAAANRRRRGIQVAGS